MRLCKTIKFCKVKLPKRIYQVKTYNAETVRMDSFRAIFTIVYVLQNRLRVSLEGAEVCFKMQFALAV